MSQDKYADRLLRPDTGPRLLLWATGRPAKDRRLRTTLLVGHPRGVEAVHRKLLQQPRPDHRVIGCCLPAAGGEPVAGLPVLGTPDDVVDVVYRYAVDTVAVLPSSGLDGAALRRLERELAPTRADLVLAPAVDQDPRSRATEQPTTRRGLRGVDGLGKACFDRTAAAVLLVLLAPVLLAVAAGVRGTTRGPVLVRRVRVGRHGRLFSALAFRSSASDGPGATRLGAILQRLCLDELPTLFNVLKGDMSLVGPRPRLPGRNHPGIRPPLPVRPGLIGPAQVSGTPGRVLLTDVDYVENWSPLLDLTILRKTLAAVLRGYAAP